MNDIIPVEILSMILSSDPSRFSWMRVCKLWYGILRKFGKVSVYDIVRCGYIDILKQGNKEYYYMLPDKLRACAKAAYARTGSDEHKRIYDWLSAGSGYDRYADALASVYAGEITECPHDMTMYDFRVALLLAGRYEHLGEMSNYSVRVAIAYGRVEPILKQDVCLNDETLLYLILFYNREIVKHVINRKFACCRHAFELATRLGYTNIIEMIGLVKPVSYYCPCEKIMANPIGHLKLPRYLE